MCVCVCIDVGADVGTDFYKTDRYKAQATRKLVILSRFRNIWCAEARATVAEISLHAAVFSSSAREHVGLT